MKPCRISWRRFDENGAAAIEFSLIVLPFVFMVVAILELAMFFAAGSTLEGSVQHAARLIRTGQAQQASDDPEIMFRETLCGKMDVLVRCEDVQYDVRTLDNFASFDEVETPEWFAQEEEEDEFSFEIGGVSDVVLVRVTYLYKFMTPLLGKIFADRPDGTRMLRSTVVFQTEPYDIEEDL